MLLAYLDYNPKTHKLMIGRYHLLYQKDLLLVIVYINDNVEIRDKIIDANEEHTDSN